MVERGGDIRSYHVPRATAKTIGPILKRNIEYGARIMTDSGTVLHDAIHPREHDQVNHKRKSMGGMRARSALQPTPPKDSSAYSSVVSTANTNPVSPAASPSLSERV